ncbi:EamA family transporter [Geomonas subterranea]|uniref:EamA family transporter n=1 Tax=Geomonas subterranea TaxID=2847989 RepID=A0ABX8LIQ9_9BACT|nr:EamA family transporter [Geomonas subterranea]QXE91618.1 EamA family transporter [Geomonas subterranea]QXM10291.1 EamA family transporter [Geomonas subterranea]
MWNWVTQALTALVSFAFMVLFMTAAVKRGVSVQFSMLVLSLVLTVSFAAWSAGDWAMWTAWKPAVPLLVAAGAFSVLGNWAMFLATSSSANAGYALAIIGCQSALVLLLSYWFLGGEMHWLRLVGIATCILGVVIISWPVAPAVKG